jgi:hypothetical protein
MMQPKKIKLIYFSQKSAYQICVWQIIFHNQSYQIVENERINIFPLYTDLTLILTACEFKKPLL